MLPAGRELTRRPGYTVVRSPGNPRHHWGNLLLFDVAPAPGDGERWEAAFEAELGGHPEITHRTFAWDTVDGELGAARAEFVIRGYELERDAALRATPATLVLHPRANREVTVRALDSTPEAEEALWDQVLAVQAADGIREEGPGFLEFARRRLEELRELFRAGRGAWYVALAGDQVAASLGIVVTGGRARFQSVDTLTAYRRQGICSRLIHDAAHHAARTHGAQQFVICADPEYHALGLYESLGFERVELTAGVRQRPPVDA